MVERNLARDPQGYFLGKSIMLLFLRHQHPFGRKPLNVKARQAELNTHQYFPKEVEILVFKMTNVLSGTRHQKRPACPALTALCFCGRRGWFIPSTTNHSQPPARWTQQGPFGSCPRSNITYPEAFKFSDSNFHSRKWRWTIFGVNCDSEDLFVKEKYPCPLFQLDKEPPHRVYYQARMLWGCSVPRSVLVMGSPWLPYGEVELCWTGCSEEEPTGGKHKH